MTHHDLPAESLDLHKYTSQAYLDYSLYVIHDRAVPFLGDGLKPVQRRIIYAMQQLGITHQAKYAKSARTVGDVIGKYHPHGEQACYESMVLMAQPFSFRYPLIDGQGNWGSPDDPKSFAAQRYTEARLTREATLLYDELNQGTVDFTPNFDGTIKEPVCFPSKVPFLLLNGSMGIAVGMATDVLPHNLKEIVNACMLMLSNASAKVEDLLEVVKGPDFPTGGIISVTSDELKRIYETGQGTLRSRARFEHEDGNIIITQIPYMSSPSRILEQIAEQMHAKRLPMLVDLRDESDHESPVRLVLVPRSNRVDSERLMQHLYATTDLERTCRLNLNVIGLDSKPRVYALNKLLKDWLTFRKTIVYRRLQHRVSQIEYRLEVVEGLVIAHLNIDEVIRIVREEDKPKAVLQETFEITELQATSILELRIRQLSRLEHSKLTAELSTLNAELEELTRILNSTRALNHLIRKELQAIADTYGDQRRTEIDTHAEVAEAFSESDLVSNEPVTLILSQKGWIRVAKGHSIVDPTSLNYREGDEYLTSSHARRNDACIFFDSTGRSYSAPIVNLPSARRQGEPLTSTLTPPAGARFVGLVPANAGEVILANSGGIGFRLPVEAAVTNIRAGKTVMVMEEDQVLLHPSIVHPQGLIVLITKTSRILVLSVGDIPQRRRGKGVRLVGLSLRTPDKTADSLKEVVCVAPKTKVLITSGKRKLTLNHKKLSEYIGSRGRMGHKLPRGYSQVDSLELV